MRIAQITDIHIGAANEFPHRIDCRAQFKAILEDVSRQEPDAIVLSGDLCYRSPESEAYAWIAEQLKEFSCEVIIMAGNHDSQHIMNTQFDVAYQSETDEIYSLVLWEGHQVFFLDTARGVMSDAQYAWLDAQISASARPVVFFMHHPPTYCGVPHMDELYAFRQIPLIQDLFERVNSEKVVFCGHYHVERTLGIPGQTIHITPSTFFQINAWQAAFAIDHHRPGYRLIKLTDAGISSNCVYVAPVSGPE